MPRPGAPLALALLTMIGLTAAWGQAGKGKSAATGARAPLAPTLIGLVTGDARDPYVTAVGAFHPRQGWRSAEQARSWFRRGTAFRVANGEGRSANLTLDEAAHFEEAEHAWIAHARGAIPVASGEPALAVSPARAFRAARPQALSSAVYQKAVAELVRAQRLDIGEARLTEHLRLDLNRDGTDEVLLCAHSSDEMGSKGIGADRGDYGLAALRFVAPGGGVKTILLEGQIFPQSRETGMTAHYAFLGFPDINGDGKSEIAVYQRVHEGGAVLIFTFDGKSARPVLSTGWGS